MNISDAEYMDLTLTCFVKGVLASARRSPVGLVRGAIPDGPPGRVDKQSCINILLFNIAHPYVPHHVMHHPNFSDSGIGGGSYLDHDDVRKRCINT